MCNLLTSVQLAQKIEHICAPYNLVALVTRLLVVHWLLLAVELAFFCQEPLCILEVCPACIAWFVSLLA